MAAAALFRQEHNRQRRGSQGLVEKTTWELARGLIVPQQVEACCAPWCAVLVGGGRARRVVGQQRALDAAAAVVRRSAKKSLRETPGSSRCSRGSGAGTRSASSWSQSRWPAHTGSPPVRGSGGAPSSRTFRSPAMKWRSAAGRAKRFTRGLHAYLLSNP